MPTVLVTGYEPFSTYDRNPSGLTAQALDGVAIGDATVVGCVLPVDLHAMPPRLHSLIDEHQPDLVLSLGLAGGIAGINVERVAINLVDLTRIPDNTGLAVADVPLVAGGPDALFATAPTRRIAEEMRLAGIPSALSYSAGTHLCNAALYHALLLAQRRERPYRAGFLHLPLLPEQAAQQVEACPSMDLGTIRRAVELAIAVALDERHEAVAAVAHGALPAGSS
jgi:pyroglutamyl-peptidase